jgi:hypothetical protein
MAQAAADFFTTGNRTYSIAMTDQGYAQLQEGENRMSSLSRRACYKCGNVGHYAGMEMLLSFLCVCGKELKANHQSFRGLLLF